MSKHGAAPLTANGAGLWAVTVPRVILVCVPAQKRPSVMKQSPLERKQSPMTKAAPHWSSVEQLQVNEVTPESFPAFFLFFPSCCSLSQTVIRLFRVT